MGPASRASSDEWVDTVRTVAVVNDPEPPVLHDIEVQGRSFNVVIDRQWAYPALTAPLAEKGHFPALDPLASLSRVQMGLVSDSHMEAAREVRASLARYQEAEELIRVGAYVPGGDPQTDLAVRRMPAIRRFLLQERDELSSFDQTVAELHGLVRDDESEPAKATGGTLA